MATMEIRMGETTYSASLKMLDSFYSWMAERHRIHLRRKTGAPFPWTEDIILQSQKFCNVFRVYDRTTQFLLNHVIEQGDQRPSECLFRIFVFRLFNREQTWQLLQNSIGPISLLHYDKSKYFRVLDKASSAGQSIYGAAYFIPSPRIKEGSAFENHLLLLKQFKDQRVPSRLLKCRTLHEAHALLTQFPGIGKFLAYQLILDINLTSHVDWCEASFVTSGPGSEEGLRLIFGKVIPSSVSQTIKYLHRSQNVHWKRLKIIDIPTLGSAQEHGPGLPDIEHALCEFAKYIRIQQNSSGHLPIRRPGYRINDLALTYNIPSKWATTRVSPSISDDATTETGVSEEEEAEYEVSHIVEQRMTKGKVLEYRIRWVGYEEEDDTWLKEENLDNAQETLDDWRRGNTA